MEEVEELISLFCYQTFDSSKLILLRKILKAARVAIADCVILNHTNTKFFITITQKKTTSSTYKHLIQWLSNLCIQYRGCGKEKITHQKQKKEERS